MFSISIKDHFDYDNNSCYKVKELFNDRAAHVLAYMLLSNYVLSRTSMNDTLRSHLSTSNIGCSNRFIRHSNWMYDSYRELGHNFVAERLCTKSTGYCKYWGDDNWCSTCMWDKYVRNCVECAGIGKKRIRYL